MTLAGIEAIVAEAHQQHFTVAGLGERHGGLRIFASPDHPFPEIDIIPVELFSFCEALHKAQGHLLADHELRAEFELAHGAWVPGP